MRYTHSPWARAVHRAATLVDAPESLINPFLIRRSGFEAATSPPWPETLAVVVAVLHRWPSLSKTTTCQGWRAGERGEQAGAQAQPRARTLSPHGRPVSRAGSEKVLATGHRFENKRQESLSQEACLFRLIRLSYAPLTYQPDILSQYISLPLICQYQADIGLTPSAPDPPYGGWRLPPALAAASAG